MTHVFDSYRRACARERKKFGQKVTYKEFPVVFDVAIEHPLSVGCVRKIVPRVWDLTIVHDSNCYRLISFLYIQVILSVDSPAEEWE